jgi:hypothetical protein
MVIPNLFYYLNYFIIYCKFIFDIFSKSNYSNDVLLMFEPSCILIQTFWNLNISIMTMLNPSKVKVFKGRFEALKTHFSMWIRNAFFVCNMLKHALNILWRNHKNENLKLKVFIILYVYFVQNGTITQNQEKWMKVGWKKLNTTS